MNSSHEVVLIRKLVLLVILSAVPLIWSGIHPTNYTAASAAEEIEPTFVPGELIVKFSDSVTRSASDVINRKATFRNATTDRSDSLDRLNQKFGVGRARPVFRTELDTARLPNTSLAALKRYHQDRTEAIRQEFPSRSLRAAPGSTIPDLSHVYLLELPKEADILAAVAEFSADPHVLYAQPNYRYQYLFAPNDPFFSSSGSWGQPYADLWGLQKIQAETAWDINQGDGITVAVVDTGLDYNHPDIAANVWTNTDEIPGNGLDDDSNGFIDDVRGWDFVAPGIGDNDPMDDNGHGTHVSGTIAAVADNGLGIVGVAPEAQIMPIKALSAAGFYTSDNAAAGLHYAADNGADVVNNSWGCGGCFSDPVTEEGVTYAHGFGVVVVFAAGNDNHDVVSNAPQNQPETLLVSAFDENDQKASFSSFGLMVDVAAPGGSNVLLPGETCGGGFSSANILSLESSILVIDPDCVVSPGYLRIQGTSMAAPHVAGLAALILADRPTLTNEEVRQVIRTSADDVDAPGVDVNSGRGRINATQALATGSVLQVIITSPRSTTLLGAQASVDVIGTATGANFVSYELSVGLGTAPTEWQLIAASSSPVVDNVLGTWGELGQGFVTLRLAAIDTQGVTYDTYATLFVDKASPLVTDPGVQTAPAIDGNRVVWQDNRNGNSDIYLFDLTTNTEQQITTNSSSQTLPAIHGDRIVWQDNRNGNFDIYLFDLSTNTEQQITTNLSSQKAPAIHEDRIVWEDKRNGNLDIYLFDLSTSIEQQITNDPASQIRPAISGPGGRYIVWEDFRNVIVNANRDIYLFDVVAGTEQQITSNTRRDAAPDISGDRIVWLADNFADEDEIIFAYDVFICTYDPATQACPEQQITADEAEPVGPATTPPFGRGPRISGDKVVWRDAREGDDFEVFAHNLADGTEHQITLSPAGGGLNLDQADPDVSDNAVVWIDNRNGNLDIFHVSLSPSAEILAPSDLAEFSQGQDITFEGFGFDLFDGIVNSSLAWTAESVTALGIDLGNADGVGQLGATFSYQPQFIVEVWVGKTDDCEGLGCFANSTLENLSLSGLDLFREYQVYVCHQDGCQVAIFDSDVQTTDFFGRLTATFPLNSQHSIVEIWVLKTSNCVGFGCFATSSIDSISLSGLEAGREYRTAICPQIGCQLGPTIQLGTGESIVVNTLSASWHLITLTATDSDGNTGKDQIDIRVN